MRSIREIVTWLILCLAFMTAHFPLHAINASVENSTNYSLNITLSNSSNVNNTYPTSAPSTLPPGVPSMEPSAVPSASLIPTRKPTMTDTEVWLNVTHIFVNVGSNDVKNSQVAQTAAEYAMYQALNGIPVPALSGKLSIPTDQINIVDITLISSRRSLKGSSGSFNPQGIVRTAVTFSILGHLEEEGYNNTAKFSYLLKLRRCITTSVEEGYFTTNLREAGASAGINVFKFARVDSLPTYSEARVLNVRTYAPSSAPSTIPTSAPTWGGPNIGRCSDSVYFNCMANIEANNGDWSVCDMCMCQEYESSYNYGDHNCGADSILHTCFLSSHDCKSQLRQSWMIGFIFIGVFYCAVSVMCIYMCVQHYTKEKRVAPYKPSHRRKHRI